MFLLSVENTSFILIPWHQFLMLRISLGFILVVMMIKTFGQDLKDKQIVIQMSIDLEELQMYYHEDEIQGRKPLIIFNNGIVQPDLNLTKFGEDARFMTKEELFFDNKQAYIDFEKFIITPNEAIIEFQYEIEGISVFLTLEKIADNWRITKKELKEK